MSNNQNKNQNNNQKKSFITKHENIFNALESYTNLYLQMVSNENIENFISKQSAQNDSNFANRLIVVPDVIHPRTKVPKETKQIMREQYGRINKLKGRIGMLKPLNEFDGIINQVLLMLMSNRLAKKIQYEGENGRYNNYETVCRKLMMRKKEAMLDLIASLYFLNRTNEYKDFFSYGFRKDDKGNNSFVIDLPNFGQICVHTGILGRQDLIQTVEDKIRSICKEKVKLQQITTKKQQEINNDLKDDKIYCPDYDGVFYEYSSAIPLEYTPRNIADLQKMYGVELPMDPEEVEETDVVNLLKVFNPREVHHIFVKIGASKEQLKQVEQLSKANAVKKKNQNQPIISKQDLSTCVISTTLEDRAKVKEDENKNKANAKEEREEE